MKLSKCKRFATLLFFGSIILSTNLIAGEINVSKDKLPVPDFAKVQIVSDGMNMNGMDLGIIQFQTDRKFSDLVDFYRKEIGEIKIGEFGQWKIISWVKRDQLYTVQVTFDELQKKTHGFIAVSNLPAMVKSGEKVKLGKGFSALTGSEFINDIKATDLNKRSRTIWLSNRSSIRTNINFYKNDFHKKGWEVEQVKIDDNAGQGALLMRKGADELNLTATRLLPMKEVNVIAVIVEK